jgi:hypothetical protein
MPAALPLRSDFDSQTLRGLARRCEDSNQSRRLLSLAAVYDGMSRITDRYQRRRVLKRMRKNSGSYRVVDRVGRPSVLQFVDSGNTAER